ncbi:MAG: DUF1553 domain-containing protein [Planctomycetota bacterium]|nr:DUF1553 domain-containing protein [Planctomycetota bacterium]
MRYLASLLFVFILSVSPSLNAVEPIRFNQDVRPILSDKCFFCHGPDAAVRKADLRLDEREEAISSNAFVPGKPQESELLDRIRSHDPEKQMPPPTSKIGQLSEKDIAILERWISEGAVYEGHWSFLSLQPVAVPIPVPIPDSDPQYQPIDAIVRDSLAKRGMTQQPPADRSTLIRRLSFDITGLPPTPQDVKNFIEDASPKAYEQLVDRLLESKHYGERMATDWLDVARYADSYGFQVDRERDMWAWRDWVVTSLNANLPFDQFIRWQIAGDLIPNATDEQILATAFNRLHQQETEGGSVEEEYRVEYVCDRVQTFATAFLGLTFECARCHDHKFDPISQKEYYQFFSMFQNIDEAGLYAYFTNSPPTPTLRLTSAATQEKLAMLQEPIDQLEAASASIRASQRKAFEEWLTKRDSSGVTRSTGLLRGELGHFSFDEQVGDKLANQVAADKPAILKGASKIVAGKMVNAVEFTGDDSVDLPIGNFARHEPFSVSLWLKTPNEKERAVVFHRSRAWTDAASRGYELLIEEGRLKWSLIHFWPGNAISIATTNKIPVETWVHVVVVSDGSSRANGLRIFVDGHLADTRVDKDKLTKEITGGGGDNIALGERFRDRGFQGGTIDEFRVFGREIVPLEALLLFDQKIALDLLAKSTAELSEKDREMLLGFYQSTQDPEWIKHLAALSVARGEYAKVADSVQEIMVMRELPEPKKAYTLIRGEYNQRRDEVGPGTPKALSPFPVDAPKNRLGLAQWLTARDHPLTARVTVNRVWQSLFGRGLVRTSEDFGSQGARPYYPAVLDWLALHLIDSGWDMKRLVKTIVMSQTYQQQSTSTEQLMTDDPDNEWLARGPRYRLPAEMIRDNVLAVSGLLNRKLGGPPVNPYEMSESFKPVKTPKDDTVYRRSMYTNWRRTGPPPAMVAFDAPRRQVCTAKRERTDSPLQALIMLNGIQYVEAARVCAESLYRDHQGNVSKMVEAGYQRCLSHTPSPREIEILVQLYGEQLAYYQSHSAEAEKLVKIGNSPRDEAIPLAQAAAATILVQALLNHDYCVVKR